MMTLKVVGQRLVLDNLRRLSREQQPIALAGVRAVLNECRKAARQRLRARGHSSIARHLTIHAKRASRQSPMVGAALGFVRGRKYSSSRGRPVRPASIAHILEFGRRAVHARPGSQLRMALKGNRRVFKDSVAPAAPRAFLFPALRQVTPRAPEIFARGVDAAIKRKVARR